MQTRISEHLAGHPGAGEAEDILRSCVHCGFCNATCPTYRLFGSELDGPRGRIYLVKSLLEGRRAGEKTRLHLDRCLACRACERTCPSGVRYSRLIHIGRGMIPRPLLERMRNRALLELLPHPGRLRLAMTFARALGPVLPAKFRAALPVDDTLPFPGGRPRRMLVLEGCVQSVSRASTNAAATRVLDALGISLEGAPGCCGAMHYHMGAEQEAKAMMRRNIDLWWPHVEAGIEAIVSTASGCGLMVKEYAEVLADDPGYAEKAKRIADLARDIAEVVSEEDLSPFREARRGRKIAFHSPCTLQHGQQLGGRVEPLLEACGFRLARIADPHLCCGAAGTYSLLQREISGKLLENKVNALEADSPELIAIANIGCELQIGSAAALPVVHWITLLDQPMKGTP